MRPGPPGCPPCHSGLAAGLAMASRTARGVGATPASFNFLADRWSLQPLARQRHDLPEGECIHAGKRPLHGFDHCDGHALRGLELRQSSSQTNILCNLKRISNSCFVFSARSPWEKERVMELRFGKMLMGWARTLSRPDPPRNKRIRKTSNRQLWRKGKCYMASWLWLR